MIICSFLPSRATCLLIDKVDSKSSSWIWSYLVQLLAKKPTTESGLLRDALVPTVANQMLRQHTEPISIQRMLILNTFAIVSIIYKHFQ
jgi:hypothetical protein